MSFKLNPTTGVLDLVGDFVDSGVVQKTCVASEDISALKLVTAASTTTVAIADKELLSDAQAIGVTTSAATTGNELDVVTFGQISDASFTFALNECLFLGNNGAITNIAPTTGHNVPIGKGLGPGAIFIDIDNITIL